MSDDDTTPGSEGSEGNVREMRHQSGGLDKGTWDSLPSDSEAEVDYPVDCPAAATQPPMWKMPTLPPTADLRVEIVVSTPDGRRITMEESQEYDLDAHDEPLNYEFDDVGELFDKVVESMGNRLDSFS